MVLSLTTLFLFALTRNKQKKRRKGSRLRPLIDFIYAFALRSLSVQGDL